jgi:uncharacterized protein YukE
MSYTNETQWGTFNGASLKRVKIDPEKAAWENNVKKIKAEQVYAERIASVVSKKVPAYLQKAMKSLDEAKHIYDCAKNLPRPQLIHTGYDVESFKSAVKIYDEETTAYNKMLERLKKEVKDAENRLLKEQTKYYSI